MSEQLFLLLDGNSLINRAYYALAGRHTLTAPDGTPTGAIHAFFNMVIKYLTELEPSHMAVTFDRREPTFRHEMFTDYKATRKPMPEDLATQIALIRELLPLWGIATVDKAGFEADDLIGSLARLAGAVMPVKIISGDKDTFQLAAEQVAIIHPVTRGGQMQEEINDPASILKRWGLKPAQLIDVKALMGDPSDNIPGIAGVGEKTALDLVQTFGSLETIFDSLAEVRPAVAKKLDGQKDNALFYRQLVTIDTRVPLPSDLALYKLGEIKKDDFRERLSRLGFKTLLNRLELIPAAQQLFTELKPATAADLKRDLAGRTDPVALWLNWPGPLVWLDRSDQPRVIAAAQCHQAWPLLTDPALSFITFNYKDWLRQSKLCYVLPRVHDVQIGAYLLNQMSGDNTLASLYQAVTGQDLPRQKDRQTSLLDDEKNKLSGSDGISVQAVAAIGRRQLELLAEQNLTTLAREIEFPLIRLLAAMEDVGFRIDKDFLTEMSAEMSRELTRLTEQIFAGAGKEFNLNSPKQLSDVLFVDLGLKPGKKRAGGTFATDAAELERLSEDHQIIPLILNYRQTSKLQATFVEGLLKAIDPADGRVHTTFNQALTSTGRLSSSEPNLQNIPIRTQEGRKIRQAFIARPGWTLIDADYSQIELRLLAHLSGDPVMSQAFLNKLDIHTDTACRIFNCSAGQVTPEQRAIAKTMNFSIIYGISDFGLARDLNVPVAVAHSLKAEYDAKYPKIRTFLNELAVKAHEKGYVETLLGRRRYLPELKSPSYPVRQFAERAAKNMPIQGTAADLIKKAMLSADRAIAKAGLKSRLILQVHDELIVEAPVEEAGQTAELLKQAMESAMTLSVPLVADVRQGTSWADCKD